MHMFGEAISRIRTKIDQQVYVFGLITEDSRGA